MSEEDDRNRYQNTFLFLRHTLYKTHGTYSIAEITNRLENGLPDIGPHEPREAEAPVEISCSKSKNQLVGTY